VNHQHQTLGFGRMVRIDRLVNHARVWSGKTCSGETEMYTGGRLHAIATWNRRDSLIRAHSHKNQRYPLTRKLLTLRSGATVFKYAMHCVLSFDDPKFTFRHGPSFAQAGIDWQSVENSNCTRTVPNRRFTVPALFEMDPSGEQAVGGMKRPGLAGFVNEKSELISQLARSH
jgi:hypothetical protein